MKTCNCKISIMVFVGFLVVGMCLPRHLSAQTPNHYEDALLDFNQDNIDEAYIHLKNALDENSRHLPSKLLMGRVLFAKQLLADALIEFEESVVMGADLNLVQLNLAKLYLLLGEHHRVLALDTNELNIANQYELLLAKATAAFSLDEDSLAQEYYENALALRPENPKGIQAFIYFYLFTEQTDQAKQLFRQLKALAPSDYKTLHLEAAFAKREQNWDRQIALLEQANSLAPNEPLIMRSLASAYININNTQAAIELLEAILSQTPDDPFASILYAELIQSVDPGLSEEIFNKLNQNLSLIPSNIISDRPELRYAQALATYLNGNYEQAVREFEAYYASSRNDLTAISVLADIYIKLGQSARALKLLDDNISQVESNLRLILLLCDLYIDGARDYNCELLKNKLADSLGPQNPNVLLVEVKILSARNKHSEALELFTKHFGNQTDRLFVYYRIDLYRKNGMHQQALDEIRSHLEREEQDKLARLLKAEVLMNLQEFDEAEAILLEILSDNTSPHATQAKRNLAFLYVAASRFSEGSRFIDELLVEFPQDPYLLMLHGEVLLADDKVDKAIEEFLLAKSILDGNPRPSQSLVDIYLSQGDFDSALTELNVLVRNEFLNPLYIQQRANLHVQMGNYANAIRDLNTLFGIWSKDRLRLLDLAQQQSSINDLVGAERSIQTALSLDPQAVDNQLAQVRLNIAQSKYEGAESKVKNILNSSPNNLQALIVAGDLYAMQNKDEAAYLSYEKAIKVQPNFSLAAVKLYELALGGVKVEATIDTLTSLSLADNINPLVENMLGDIHLFEKRYDEALEHYLRVIDIESYPNRSSVLNNIASIYVTIKSDVETAREFADRGFELAPNSIQSLSTRGWILAKSKDYESALPYLRQAFTLDSSDSQVRYHMAYALYYLGRENEARQELDMALQSDEYFFGREQALALKETMLADAGMKE